MHKDVLKYRQGLLLACAGALLHNLGKVNSRFVESQVPPKPKKEYEYQHICGLFVEDVNIQNKISHLSSIEKKWAELYIVLQQSPDNKDTLNDASRRALKNPIGPFPYPFNDRSYRIGDLIEYLGQGEKLYPHAFNAIFGSSSLLTHLMNCSHRGASGGDKEGIMTLQQRLPLYTATPLGYEKPAPDLVEYDRIKEEVEQIIQKFLADPQKFSLIKFMRQLEPLLRQIPADTQRGLNDITVWDIGQTGMAFLKSAFWSCKGKSLNHDDLADWKSNSYPRWRLWRVVIDGLDFLSDAVSVADLRVRQRKLRAYLDAVQRFAEEAYPVATEVYRDENGAIYIFPDWEKRSAEYEYFNELYNYIFQSKACLNVNVEEAEKVKKTTKWPSKNEGLALPQVFGIRPVVELSKDNYHHHPECKRVNNSQNHSGGPVVDYIGSQVKDWIKNPLAADPDPEEFRKGSGRTDDICPYCGMRTVGGGEDLLPIEDRERYSSYDAMKRKICCVCMRERGRIAEEWWKEKPFSTIWVDEVADSNGCVALVVGKFDVEKMLDEMVYLSKLEQKCLYIPYWEGLSPSTPCSLKIKDNRNKEVNFNWDGVYLEGPWNFTPYKCSKLKVKKFDGRDTDWEPELSIERVEFNTTYGHPSLKVYLADDNLLITAKLFGIPGDWPSLMGKEIEALEKKWKIIGVRVIELLPSGSNEAEQVYKDKFLWQARDPHNARNIYYLKLIPAEFKNTGDLCDSFARFRRVWETTANFWREVAPPEEYFPEKKVWHEALSSCLATKTTIDNVARRRLVIILDSDEQIEVSPFYAYELTVENVKIGVFCTDPKRKEFVSIENLNYIARQLGALEKEVCDPCAAIFVVSKIKNKKCRLDYSPSYGHRGQLVTEKANIKEVSIAPISYYPVIPILAEPRIFAALVPGQTAFELVQRIKRKYEQEIGKVRWRLPLTLGVVFFQKHTPLRVVMDAGWRLIKVDTEEEIAKIEEVSSVSYSYLDDYRNRQEISHPQGKFWPQRVKVTVEVMDNCNQISWDISTAAGDGCTFDIWYPWVKVEGTIKDRPLAFADPRVQQNTWVHVMELKKDDKIKFFPSTFDFVFLDHAGRRFELAYDKNGRRLGLERRPYYLEEIDLLTELWELIGGKNGLSSTQIHALWQVLIDKWQEWQPFKGDNITKETWRSFCYDTILNAGWPSGVKFSEEIIEKLVEAAEKGVLFDVFELFLSILKTSPHRSEK